ncbi:MAG: hypothetical protein WDO69_03065 [Pseudomonadota bacterium]
MPFEIVRSLAPSTTLLGRGHLCVSRQANAAGVEPKSSAGNPK